jgi:ribosomal protein L40E
MRVKPSSRQPISVEDSQSGTLSLCLRCGALSNSEADICYRCASPLPWSSSQAYEREAAGLDNCLT